MSFFTRLVGSGGAGAEAAEVNVVDTVEKLLERVETATLLEDRRDAVKALKSLAKKYRMEVGGRGMDVMVDVLRKEKGNTEMVALALETLVAIVGAEDDADCKDELGERFAEMFIKHGTQVALVLEQLDEWDFAVRRAAMRLLTALLRLQAEELQTALLSDPQAIPRLLDLLQETREVLRNDAILMMCELTRGNASIQKLVAFENAFQILLDIITYEGDKSIVVEDCLFCILNLLKNNPSNQQLFREHSLIQHLGELLKNLLHPQPEEGEAPPPEEEAWSPQKVANVLLLFQVIRSLVAPSNSQQITAAAQKIIHQCGMLSEMSGLLLESGVPVEVLTESIRAVAESMRGNSAAQAFFASIEAPSTPPKPLVLVLLLSMTNERQPFALRCSVLYAFQSFLQGNKAGKSGVVHTLLPSGGETGEVTAGHVLCTGLLSPDPLLVWLSAVALHHALLYEPKLKEELLRVQLATSVGEGPVSLLEQVCGVLVRGGGSGKARAQLRAGLLQLLSVWLADCPVAVAHFLSRSKGDDHLGFLTSTAAAAESGTLEGPEAALQGLSVFLLGLCVLYNDNSVEKTNRAALTQLIERRIGRDVAVERLDQVSRSEEYVRAAQRPHPAAKAPGDLIFDHEFTRLFKSLEGDVRKVLGGESAAKAEDDQDHNSIVTSYKDLIKRQDAQIAQLTAQLKKTQSEQMSNGAPLTNGNVGSGEVEALRWELSEKCRLLEAQSAEMASLQGQTAAPSGLGEGSPNPQLLGEKVRLEAEVAALQASAAQRTQESAWYYQQLEQWRSYQVGQLGVEAAAGELSRQLGDVETQLQWGWAAFEEQATKLAAAEGARAAAEEMARLADAARHKAEHEATLQLQVQTQQTDSEAAGRAWEARVAGLESELGAQKRETEDLLVLLADQDTKIREYRQRLRGLGQELSEEEDDEEDPSLR